MVTLFRNDGSLQVHNEHLTHTKEKKSDVPIPVVTDWTGLVFSSWHVVYGAMTYGFPETKKTEAPNTCEKKNE